MQTLASNSRYSGRTLDIFVEKRLCFDAEAIKKSSPPRELLLFQFVILLRSLRRGMVASENKVHQCNILLLGSYIMLGKSSFSFYSYAQCLTDRIVGKLRKY